MAHVYQNVLSRSHNPFVCLIFRPVPSLNLGALRTPTRQQDLQAPQPTSSPLLATSPLTSASASVIASVPKLNLAPMIQQRDDDQEAVPYKVQASVGSSVEGGSALKAPKEAQPEPVDHFYYYPKLDSKVRECGADLLQYGAQMFKSFLCCFMHA